MGGCKGGARKPAVTRDNILDVARNEGIGGGPICRLLNGLERCPIEKCPRGAQSSSVVGPYGAPVEGPRASPSDRFHDPSRNGIRRYWPMRGNV